MNQYIPQNKIDLYLFWFLVSNAGAPIPYWRFCELDNNYYDRDRLSRAVDNITANILENGFTVERVANKGYLCCKVRAV